MSQYVPISTPADEIHRQNRSLICLITYLGKKYKEANIGLIVQMKPDYIVGLDYINKKCGKRCKSAIRNLMVSKEKNTSSGEVYQKWGFHKQKAEKFFLILYRELMRINADEEIWDLFDYLYNYISNSLPIERRGSHIISYPYRSALNQAVNGDQYSQKEKEIVAKILKTFLPYDRLYHI